MAIAATNYWEVEFGGSDSLNGGGFDPGSGTRDAVLTASNATTSAPTVSSANYTFTSSDKFLFIKSGTNWIPGMYPITSVSGGVATLNAAIGAVTLYQNADLNGLNTVAGCATTASPTAGTWSVDYSQQSAAISLTGLTSAAANAIILTSAATKAMVGNSIQITGGTNFTAGVYTITAASAGVSLTVDRNSTTAAGAAGTGGVGGAFASLGQVGKVIVASNRVFQQYNASQYQITSASSNVAGGCLSFASRCILVGYNSNRHLANVDASRPINQASSISTAVLITPGFGHCRNIIVDGQSLTSIRGFANSTFFNCTAINCTNSGFQATSFCYYCLAYNCTVQPAFLTGDFEYCAAINCTSVVGFQGGPTHFCVAASCGTGFSMTVAPTMCLNCTAFGCSVDGFKAGADSTAFTNCISYGNTGKGYNANSGLESAFLNSAAGSNTGGDLDTTFIMPGSKIALIANPFVNSGATFSGASVLQDVWNAFALNSTAGGGAACRAAALLPYQDLGAVQHQDSTSRSQNTFKTGGAL